jgi:hypothetical protein
VVGAVVAVGAVGVVDVGGGATGLAPPMGAAWEALTIVRKITIVRSEILLMIISDDDVACSDIPHTTCEYLFRSAQSKDAHN